MAMFSMLNTAFERGTRTSRDTPTFFSLLDFFLFFFLWFIHPRSSASGRVCSEGLSQSRWFRVVDVFSLPPSPSLRPLWDLTSGVGNASHRMLDPLLVPLATLLNVPSPDTRVLLFGVPTVPTAPPIFDNAEVRHSTAPRPAAAEADTVITGAAPRDDFHGDRDRKDDDDDDLNTSGGWRHCWEGDAGTISFFFSSDKCSARCRVFCRRENTDFPSPSSPPAGREEKNQLAGSPNELLLSQPHPHRFQSQNFDSASYKTS